MCKHFYEGNKTEVQDNTDSIDNQYFGFVYSLAVFFVSGNINNINVFFKSIAVYVEFWAGV